MNQKKYCDTEGNKIQTKQKAADLWKIVESTRKILANNVMN